MEIDEVINDVFIDIKEMFPFLGLSDLDIYNLIKKNIVKNKNVTKDELLKKVSNCCSKQIVNCVMNDSYDEMDRFFEEYFICFDKKEQRYEALNKLIDLLGNVNRKFERDLYIKLFKRYNVLSNLLIDVLEDSDYSIEKIKELDKRVQKILQIYCEFSGVLDKINVNGEHSEIDEEFSFDDSFDGTNEIISNYYRYHDMESLKEFIVVNMPLVKSIAKKYKGQGLSYDDLLQEGLIGFLKAINKFDPTGKSKLSSYAYPSIKRHIIRAINSDSRDIRIPDWRCEELKKYVLEKRNFINNYGYEPKVEEMAELLNMSLEKAYESELLSSNYVCSLNSKVDDENETEFGDLLKDKTSLSPEDMAIESYIKDDINEILKQVLTEQEKAIIDLAFGRYDGIVRNNAEVGEDIYEYGLYPKPLTRERVRQLRSSAIKKLQREKKLEAYL